MKNTIKIKAICKIAGIIALLAVIGFSMAACGDGSGGGGGSGSTSLAGKTFVGMGGLMKVSFTATNYTLYGFGEAIHSGTYKVTDKKVTITVTKVIHPDAGAEVGDVYTCTIIDDNTLLDDDTETYLYRI